VETVTKSTTTQMFAAAQPWHDSDASKVKSRGSGLQKADTNKDATFSVDTSDAGKLSLFYLSEKASLKGNNNVWLL
jgi:hypothetical protein